MDWKTMVRYISGSVDEELLLRNEYLVAENRVLRNQIQVCSARSRSGVDCQGKRICCCSQPATCAFYLFIRQPMGRKSALRREIPWILRGFQGCLSC